MKKEKLKDRLGRKFLGDAWDNKRERSIILLVIWLIFFIFVFIYIGTNSQNQTKKSSSSVSNETINYPEIAQLINQLETIPYHYDIALYDMVDSNFIYYNGSRSAITDTGIKKVDDQELSYSLDHGLYLDSNNQAIDNLFDATFSYFWQMDNLNKFIKDLEPTISYEQDLKVYKYAGTYQEKNIEILIKTNDQNISYINLNYNNKVYVVNINID